MPEKVRTEAGHLRVEAASNPAKIRGVAMHAGRILSRPDRTSGKKRSTPAMRGGHQTVDPVVEALRTDTDALMEVLDRESWSELQGHPAGSQKTPFEQASPETPKLRAVEKEVTDG